MELISVIIPVYKTANYLPRCLDSVLSQTYTNLEIILVDDGSPDNSGNICDEYAKRDNRIVVIHQMNQGVSAARNAGLKIAKGDYIGFIDSDDYIHTNMYQKLYELIKETNADLAQCRYQERFPDDIKEPYKYIISNKIISNRIESIKLLFTGPITFTGVNKLYSKKVVEKIYFPTNTGMCEDLVFVYLTLKKTKIIANTNEIYYDYCMDRQDSASKLSLNMKGAITAFDFIKNDLNSFAPDLIKTVNTFEKAQKSMEYRQRDLILCKHLMLWARMTFKHRIKDLLLNSDCPNYRILKSFLILLFPNFSRLAFSKIRLLLNR